MKILVYGGLAGPGPVAGGVWRVAQTQTQILRDNGHHVHLFGLWLGTASRADEGHPDTHLLPARPPFPGARYRALWTPALWRHAMRTGPYDITHLHLARDYASTRLLWGCDRAGIPLVVQTHGMLTQSPKRTTRAFDAVFRHKYLSAAQTWLALTASEVSGLQRYGVPSNRIRLINNLVLASGKTWHPTEPQYFLFASRLHPRKQADVFVKAAIRAAAQEPAMQFVIAGPDEGHAHVIDDLISTSAFSQNFRVLGPIDSDELQLKLSNSFAMVLPSKDEIAPMIVIESAEIGTPMILTTDSGLSAGLQEATAALVVEPTVEQVADAMLTIWRDPHLRYELSERSRLYYRAHWAPARVLTDLEDVYAECTKCIPRGI